MLKNISRLEQIIADKVYHLTCDSDSPLSHVKEALVQFLKYIGNIEDKYNAENPPAEKVEEKCDSEACSEEPKQE